MCFSLVCYPRKKDLSDSRPTGRLAPNPADLSWASCALAALESRAQRGAIILLDEDATIVWRLALPRAGWWRRTVQRFRLPIRPLRASHIKRAEVRKRQAWGPYRRWSRVARGGLSVIGAVHYGTAKVFATIVPQCDPEGFRHSLQQVMALFGHTGTEVVMVVDRSGIHRAHQLASTLTHWHEQFRLS